MGRYFHVKSAGHQQLHQAAAPLNILRGQVVASCNYTLLYINYCWLFTLALQNLSLTMTIPGNEAMRRCGNTYDAPSDCSLDRPHSTGRQWAGCIGAGGQL